jgi:beta-glucosidase
MYQLQYFKFPKNFALGIADADLQVIGEKYTIKEEKSEPSMWLNFSKIKGKTFEGQTPLEGINRYNLWKEDLKVIKDLGTKHVRVSVSMSRVMTKDKKPNHKALDWYKNYFQAMRKMGIKLYITLYHWDLPQYLADMGGWKNRIVTEYLVEHAKIVYNNLNEYIEEYFILNEPFQFTFESYHNGIHAPGEKNLKGALSAVHHAMLAQGMIYRTLRGLNKKIKLSTTYNPSVTYAASASPEDLRAAHYAWGYHTGMFTDPLYLGKYPEHMMEIFEDKMPKIENGDMDTIKVGDGLHSFGINFYRGRTAKYDPKSDNKYKEARFAQGVRNGLGWPVYIPPTYPEALYDLLRELYHRYSSHGMKRITITESGTCCDDELDEKGQINDDFRIFFIREHFKQIAKAILSGIPVTGYFVWTLMDNFEWDCAHNPESSFGLVKIDRKNNLKRIPRKSFYWYKETIKTNKIV